MQAASDELNWGQLALDIGVGAVTGMLGTSGISQLGATFAGAGIGGLSNLASQLIQGTSFNDIKWSQVLVGVAIGAAAGFLGGAGAKNAKAINNAKGVKEATNHYNKIATKNDAMVGRLRNAYQTGNRLTGADRNFFIHELREATFMAKGFGAEQAHLATLAYHQMSGFAVYHPLVIQSFGSAYFNPGWFAFWGLL